jgi:hypothetical protein
VDGGLAGSQWGTRGWGGPRVVWGQVVGTTDEPASPPVVSAGAEDVDEVGGVGHVGVVVGDVDGGVVLVVEVGVGHDGRVDDDELDVGGRDELLGGRGELPGGCWAPPPPPPWLGGVGFCAPGFFGGCSAATCAGFTGVVGSGSTPLAYASAQISTVRT